MLTFSKKGRLPRKEKKRRAKLLNPPKRVKYKPYADLTYEKLEKVIHDALFGAEAEKKFKQLQQNFIAYGAVFVGPENNYIARTEKLTLDEIKERFSITAQEEEALRTLPQTMDHQLLEVSNKRTPADKAGEAEGSTGNI